MLDVGGMMHARGLEDNIQHLNREFHLSTSKNTTREEDCNNMPNMMGFQTDH